MTHRRTILVTGGNRGIGLAVVRGFAQNNHDRIILGCRDLEEGERIASQTSGNVHAERLDLSSPDVLKQCVNHITKQYSTIDVLVNNAGVLHYGDGMTHSEEDFFHAMHVNAMAPYLLIKAILPDMCHRNYGRIVNVSSGWGALEDGLSGPFSYSVSKATLNAITLSLSHGLPRNVKINAMCPGWVRTKMGGAGAPRSPQKGAETILWLANLSSSGPSGLFFRDKKPINW